MKALSAANLSWCSATSKVAVIGTFTTTSPAGIVGEVATTTRGSLAEPLVAGIDTKSRAALNALSDASVLFTRGRIRSAYERVRVVCNRHHEDSGICQKILIRPGSPRPRSAPRDHRIRRR